MSLDVTLTLNQYDCPHCSGKGKLDHEVFSANITHNLVSMANAAGIYKHLWRPEELGLYTAHELIEPLEKGLADMKVRPEHYKTFNAENGWGLYENFVPWIESYLNACKANPHAKISVSR